MTADRLRGRAAIIKAWNDLPDAWRCHPALKQLHQAAQECEDAQAPAEVEVKAILKVVKGEICYRSQDDDQSFGMWVPVTPDAIHGFADGAVFAAPKPQPKGLMPGRDWLEGMVDVWRINASESSGDVADAFRTCAADLERALKLNPREALTSPAVAHGWRPIGEAPKDGTEVWTYNGEQGRMKWIEGEGYALWAWADTLLSDTDPMPEQPTHFMPLLADPVLDVPVQQTGGAND